MPLKSAHLTMNPRTSYDILFDKPLILLAIVTAWLALMVLVYVRKGARWRLARNLSVFAGVVSALSALFMVPMLDGSGLAGLQRGSDWAALFLTAAGFGLVTTGFTWPALATLLRRREGESNEEDAARSQ